MTTIRLCSQSPRRSELLQAAGYAISVDASNVVEPSQASDQSCSQYAKAMAILKWSAHPSQLSLSADTVVCVDNRALGKPKSEIEAIAMYRLLENRLHTVITACAYGISTPLTLVATAKVRFPELDDDKIASLLADNYYSYAGGYAIQGGANFAAVVHGNIDTVIGLPVTELTPYLGNYVD